MKQKAHADCVVVGEGEKAFSGIVKARINGEVVAAIVQGEPVENLDDLPSPAFDLLDMDFYLKVGAKFPKLPSPNIAMVTSRNCPYRCRFCFVEGTKITLSDGSVAPIEKIKVNDKLLTYNPKLNRTEETFVTELHSQVDSIFEVTFEDGTVLKISGEHPVWT